VTLFLTLCRFRLYAIRALLHRTMSSESSSKRRKVNGHTNGHTNGYASANGSSMPSSKKALRIGGASGGFTDRQRSIYSLAQLDVDVIVGDWMSECTMSWHGAAKSEYKKKVVRRRSTLKSLVAPYSQHCRGFPTLSV